MVVATLEFCAAELRGKVHVHQGPGRWRDGEEDESEGKMVRFSRDALV